VQGSVKKTSKLSVRSVFRSEMLWKIYGTIAISILIALVTAAVVFLYRYPLLEAAEAYEIVISLMVAVMAGAIVALALGFWLARGVKKSLTELTSVAQSLTCGDFSARVKKLSDDEFGLLGLTLNLLGEEIAERMATLSQERTQLAALFGGMVEGIVAIGDDDRVLFANGAADRLLKTQASLSRSKQISEVPGLGILLPLVIQCRTEKKRKHIELTLGDGEGVVSLETHASPFKGEQNAGVVVVLHDVTELRRLERVRRDFVANVSHELKTPLTSIKGYLETLQNGAKHDPEVLDRFLHRIDANVGRLVELVQDILSLARVEAQDGALRRSAVDLPGIARQSLIQHEHSVTKKNIALRVQMEDNVVVQGDREAVRQVIDNLLVNAIKYTPEGGSVTLGIQKEQNNAILRVMDTGVGIPPEHHGRIFERFYRVDKHRNREDGGTGLGLSIVKHLVQSMNGKVSVESEPGRGSTFLVQMNLHQ
jgi:two-component system phosphate regulon sensor histidine kinase PhoR